MSFAVSRLPGIRRVRSSFALHPFRPFPVWARRSPPERIYSLNLPPQRRAWVQKPNKCYLKPNLPLRNQVPQRFSFPSPSPIPISPAFPFHPAIPPRPVSLTCPANPPRPVSPFHPVSLPRTACLFCPGCLSSSANLSCPANLPRPEGCPSLRMEPIRADARLPFRMRPLRSPHSHWRSIPSSNCNRSTGRTTAYWRLSPLGVSGG